MKKPTFSKTVYTVLILLLSFSSVAQTYKEFAIRKNIDLRGSMLVAGNSILGNDKLLPFNDDTKSNEDISMVYINIDNGATPGIFSSSSADLVVPKQANGNPTTCYRIAYAALYWGAILQSGSRTDINKIKFKLPGAATYTDISGTVVYDAVTPIPAFPNEAGNSPYVCYADVTNELASLSNLNGTYTVANVISSEGKNGSTGLAAGWTLFVIYEDPSLNMKSFTTFDGFTQIFDGHVVDVPVSGFTTPQSGPVDLQFAYAALDGDITNPATKLEINGKEVVTPFRSPSNHFFRSVIENTNGISTPRVPDGINTLGYDTGMLEIQSANPAFIKNNVSSADFALQVARGQADPIFSFFGSFAVDIIAPKIDLTKIVKNTSGVDIGGGNVNLAQSIVYEISYQSTGNDNVTNFTIKDVLPLNLVFDPATGIDYTNAGGATLQSYDAATRTLIFNIPPTSVEVNDGLYTIRLNVQVAPDCNSLATACSNEIKNQAFATYQGVINTDVVQEEGSYASTVCKLGAPESTNFIVDISNCKFTQNVILCGSSVVLRASDGYSNYSWSRNPDGSSPIGTGQTFTATQTGVYYVHNTAPLTCKDIVEEITVTHFGVTNTNPVIPFADQLVTCVNDGKVLPNIFLCGANATRTINTGISDAASIVWEKLDEVTCPSTAIANCANENFASSCWKQVGTGPDYTANTAGQFRVILNYTGGCFSIFYFNVYQNLLDPTFTKKDIICSTPGKITIEGVPTGYEFSLDGVNYLLNNPEFPITVAGNYTVYIKQQGVTSNPCIFQVPNILINNRTMNVRTFVTQPSCNGINDGSIKLIAENVEPQYYFSIEQGGTIINSVGPISATNEQTFANLSPGNYTVKVWTDDNCTYTGTVDIINPPLIKVTANVTKPLTCTDGEITINIEGGTPNYNYYVNGTYVILNTALTSFAVPVSTAGTYAIKVDDLNNCPAVTSVEVSAIPAPVYTVTSTNNLCYGSNIGEIQFNVTNANGYTLAYSIDNGVTYLPTPIFSNLADGTYNTIVRYTLGTSVCYGTMEEKTITGPASAVTASAGVSELAGCTLSGQGGKLRITNPQGGVAPYEYSFDNQATWVTTNEADMLPGTYTLYVKDANGCIYAMPNVILDPKPVPPTIDVASPVFNCDGTANSTVTVTNSGSASYEYGYLLNGTANTNVPSNVFVNVPSGSHTVSVTYKLLTVPTYSNLLKEDFGNDTFTWTPTASPDASSPGINPAFCWERQVNATKCNADSALRNGEYTVTSTLRNNFYPGWNNPVDHTAGSATGRYLAVDAGTAIPNNAVLYRKTIKDIIPNQPIQVRFFATNLLKVGNPQPDASLTVELQNASGVALSSQSTGGIPKTNGWVEYNRTIDPGNNTTLDFVLRLEVAQVDGIDFAVDDIEVYQLPKTCITQVDFPFVVPTGKAFTGLVTGSKDITCAGANNGEITLTAANFDTVYGFDYSIDGGTTWVNSKVSPVTITGLSANTYTPLLRYNAAGACPLTLTAVTINTPTPIVANASVTQTATCTTGATITASATGGTPAYQYELRQSDGVTVVTAFNDNPAFTNVTTGDYTVFVRDINLCTTSVGIPVSIVAPPAITATLDSSTDLCYTSANPATLVVNVTGGTAPFVYSLNGAAAQTSNTFINVGPGTHEIVVTDSKNCTATISSISIASQLLPVASVTKALDCSTTPNATITVNIAGGTAPYTYTVQKGTGTPSAASSPSSALSFTYDVSNANADTYTFVVTDANGCPATTSATVNPITNPTVIATPTQVSCNGGTDGAVQLVGAGGSGGYTYSFNGSPFTTTTNYTGLSAGIAYPYQVNDSNNCTVSGTITLTQPSVLDATASATAFSCSVTNTKQSATVTIDVPTTGTAPYEYSFNGGGYAAANTLTVNDNGTDQVITYSVRDVKGCIDGGSVTILKLNSPTDLDFSAAAVTCSATTTTVTVTATNGVGTLTYAITSPLVSATSNTTGVFAGLLPNTYIFKVTDANGCYYTESYVVAPVTPIAIVGNVNSNIDCNGNATGNATFNVSGNATVGAYSFVLTAGTLGTGTLTKAGDVLTLANVKAGTYTVQVTDTATGCINDATVIITEPTIVLSVTTATPTNVNCNNDFSQISVVAAGGTPNYTYAAVITGATAPTVFGNSNVISVDTNSGADLVWDVYVKDANGCITTSTVSIPVDGLPSVTASADNQCTGSGNGFTITAVGTGLGPLTYSINGTTFQTSNIFTVVPGTYTITVKDKNGCTATTATPTIAYPALTASAVLTKDLTCSLPADATIDVTVTGGKAPFGYRVKIGAGSYSGSPIPFAGNSFTYSTLAADTFQFEITDANGCPIETNGIITTSTVPVTASVEKVDPTCNGFTDGSIKLTALTGEAPFTYSITGLAGPFVSSNVFGGLAAGTYDYAVKDNKGCVFNDPLNPIVLVDPAPILANIVRNAIQCNNNTPGSIDISITSGGVAPYVYKLYDNTFTQIGTYTETNPAATPVHNFGGLNFGDYYITVVDAKGCEFNSAKLRIETPPYLTMTAIADSNSCATGVNVTVTTSGGTGPYRYSIFGQPESGPFASNSYTFVGLSHGVTYFLQVKDFFNCISILEFTTPNPPSGIKITGTSSTNVTCNATSTGTLAFTVQDYDPTVTSIKYEVLNALTLLPVSPAITNTLVGPLGGPVSENITALPAGNYVLQVTEVGGTLCSAAYTFSIAQPAQPLLSSVASVVNANCNSGAQLTLTTTGGTGPYTYAVAVAPGVPSTFTPGNVLNLDYSLGTNWNITVKDANGCTVDLSQVIFKDAEPTINPVDLQCYTGSPLSITLSGTTSVGTPTYSIGGAYQASPTFAINAPGTYNNVSIKDGNGCIASTTYEVKPQVLLQADLTQDLTCITDASITLTPSGGTGIYTPPYEVSINGNPYTAASSPYTTNVAGSYVFRVYDNQVPACPAISNTVIVTPTTTPTFTVAQTNVTCVGGADGSIVVTAGNGIAPYQYSIDNGLTYQASNVFSGLNNAVVYKIVVKDSKDCPSDAVLVDITEPTAIVASAAVTTTLSCGTSNATQPATVTVTASGGTGSLQYSFDGGVNYTTTNTFTTNSPGVVSAMVKDANGCVILSPVTATVLPLNPPTDLGFNSTTVTCLATTSNVTLIPTNGTGPLSYTILPAVPVGVTQPVANEFHGLLPGTYLFQVTDANGCTYQESFTVNPVTNITVSGQLVSNVTCNPGSNGAVQLTVANFGTTYSYSINGAPAITGHNSSTVSVSGITATSTQTIVVTDEVTGCTATTFINVTQPAPLALTANPFINANCNNGAQVSVTASGGVAPYSYSFVVSGSTAGTYSTSNAAVLNPATSTNWDVWVKDANNCVIATPFPITIATDPLPTVTVNTYSQCPSVSGDYTFTVVASGIGPFEYSIGAGFQTSPTFTVNVPGVYNVTVKDANICQTTANGLVNILTPLTLTPTVSTLPSCANNDGVITVSATGGSGNYEFNIDGGAFGAATTFNNVASGSHSMGVRDTTTGCEVFVPINLTPATPITGFALSTTPVTCNGGNDGTITATMATPAPGVNDNPVYTYALNGMTVGGVSVTRPSQSSPLFSGLTAGNYTVVVTSGRGCTEPASIPVIEPGVIVVPTPTVVPFNCNSGTNASNFATITVNGVSGGSGTYSIYEFFKTGVSVQRGASNVYTVTDLSGGNYTVTVYDNKGCPGSATVPAIAPFIALDKVNVVVNNAISCTNLEDITVTATTIGGTATNLEYTVKDVNATTGVNGGVYSQTNSNGVFTGLPVANYLITVKNLDTNCEIQDVHYVSEPNTFDLTIDSVVDVTCFNDTNGSVNVTLIDRAPTPTDESGPFNYTVYDIANPLIPVTVVPLTNSATRGPITISGLAGGTYMITATLTNRPYCSVSKNFTITRPAVQLAISAAHTDITCVAGNNDGTITASATGGWPGGYEFQLELASGTVVRSWGTSPNFTGLTANNYIVKVRDSKDCSVQATVNLMNPTPIVFTATPSATTLSCFGDRSASITASMPTGGQGSNYLYTLNTTSLAPATSNGPQTSPIFNGLGAGTYTITVTDGYSCSSTSAPIIIFEPTKVTASLVVASTQTCGNLTTLALSANGGTGSYSYSVDGINYNAMTSNPMLLQVPVGTYHYFVRDANGCSSNVSNDIKIDPLVPLTINLDKLNPVINCAGDSNGVIAADAQGGLGNYVYTLTNLNTGVATAPQSSGVFNGLIAGDYRVHVDSGDCTVEVLVTITQPTTVFSASAVGIPVTCTGNGDGKIVITAGGGTGEIRYAISPNSDQFFVGNMAGGHSFNNLKPGFYDVISQDQNGCFQIDTVEITEPEPIIATVVANSEQQELCAGDKTGAFSISITGGTGSYSTSLDDPNGTYVLGQFDFTGLSGGVHTVYIKDGNTCPSELVVSLDPAVILNPVATVSNECVNDLPANKVTVTIDASNNPADVLYSLDNSSSTQASNVFTNLPPGDHFIMVHHKNGCIDATDTFTIDQIDPLTISIDLGRLNEIVATVTGGSGVYRFTVNGEDIGSNNKYVYFRSGNYTVTVTDSNGCSISATKYFEFIDIIIPPIFTPTGDGTNDTWKPLNTENYPDVKFVVYDRYGREVGTFGAGQSWDGKYKGTELPMGDYWYVLKLRHSQDDREFVGHFTLYR